MSSNSFSRDRLALPHSHHVPPLLLALPRGLVHHQEEHRSSRRRYSAQGRSRRPRISPSDMRLSPEDVTDIVLSTEYSWSPTPWAGSMHYPSTNLRETGVWTSEPPIRLQHSMGEGNLMRVRYADVDGGDNGPPTPPRTPQIGILETPELGPVEECSQFCHCCTDDERYREGRSKMDSQRKFIVSSCGRHLRTMSIRWDGEGWQDD